LQPVIYKMAGSYKYGEGSIKNISFHYLSKGKIVEFEISTYILEKSKKRIEEVTNKIFKGVFPSNVNGGCESCEFRHFASFIALSKLSRKSL